MKPITQYLDGKLYPVKTGNAPGLSDGLYLVRKRNEVGQEVDKCVAIVAETAVGWTMLCDQLSHLKDAQSAVEIAGRKTISGRPEMGDKSVVGIYHVPGTAERAVEMGRANGFEFGE
mgnify:CR=1 FL=1